MCQGASVGPRKAATRLAACAAAAVFMASPSASFVMPRTSLAATQRAFPLAGAASNCARRRGAAVCVEELPHGAVRYTSGDWLHNLASLPYSSISQRILGHLVANTGWACVVTLLHTYRHISLADWHVSPLPHTLMSGALGLLLVFRTNAAYDRFWEGRKIWGSVTNVIRNLARSGSQALDRVHHVRLAQLLIAYAITLRAHLRHTDLDELAGLLPEYEVALVKNDPNPPARICMKLTRLIAQNTDDTSVHRLYLDQMVGDLINCLGQCERILNTPVPPVYSHHTSRFLSIYCLTLPLVLVQQLSLFTAPVVAAICWGLFSIEEIGHVIEEPFRLENAQLPLERYTNKIRTDVTRMLQLELPFPEALSDFEQQRLQALDGLRVVQEHEVQKLRSLEKFEKKGANSLASAPKPPALSLTFTPFFEPEREDA